VSDYWTKYWQQGHLTSFGNEFAQNYTGELKQLWLDFFNQLDDKSMILDIGTGNGALIDFALQCDKSFVITGIDTATLTVPEALSTSNNVTFIEQTNTENLPFADQQYDVVISQFGLEYANLEKAISELLRVTKSKGRFHLVMHDHKSSIVKPNIKILAAANALMRDNGALKTLRQLVNALVKKNQSSALTETLRKQLNTAIAHIANTNKQGLIGTNFPPFLKYVMSPNIDYKTKKQNITLFEKELKGQAIRLADLNNAALDDERLLICETVLANNTATIEQSYLLKDSEKVIARVIQGVKN
jgi:ubiquinone/menaquinone biosynthesis C-methylase UbiE